MRQVYDLLDLTNDILAVRWDAKAKTFVVSDLLAVECNSFDDVMTVVAEGYKNRRIGSTALNKDSSRSHRWALVEQPALTALGTRVETLFVVAHPFRVCWTSPPVYSLLTVRIDLAHTDPVTGFKHTKHGKVVFVDLAGAIGQERATYLMADVGDSLSQRPH